MKSHHYIWIGRLIVLIWRNSTKCRSIGRLKWNPSLFHEFWCQCKDWNALFNERNNNFQCYLHVIISNYPMELSKQLLTSRTVRAQLDSYVQLSQNKWIFCCCFVCIKRVCICGGCWQHYASNHWNIFTDLII